MEAQVLTTVAVGVLLAMFTAILAWQGKGRSEAIERQIGRLADEAATFRGEIRSDLSALRSESRSDRAELRSELAALRSESRSDTAELRSELAAMRSETRSDTAELRSELAVMRSDLTAVALALGARPRPQTG